MKDKNKTKEQLMNELTELHRRISELEVRENECKRVEEALRDSESRCRSLVDHVPVGLYRTTPMGQILDANPTLVQLLGYPDRESLLAINTTDVYLSPEKRIQWKILIERDGVVQNFENQYRRADGSIFWAEENSRVIRDADGRVLYYEGSLEDITERKSMEEALQEGEGRLRAILEAVQAGIMIIDAETHQIVDANPVAVKLIGAPKEQIIGSVCHRYICPAEEGECPVTDLGQTIDNMERALLTSGGGICPIIKTVASVMIGGREHLIESFIDITERKRAEKALHQSEIKYRIVSDNTHDWEFWLSPEGQFNYTSPSCKRITGYDPEEFKADPDLLDRIIHPDDRPFFDNHRLKVQEGKISGQIEFRIIRQDGTTRWIGHVCLPVFDSDGHFLGTRGSNRDITERKWAEEALARQNRELEVLNETKDRFLGIAAHDLRNPLTVVHVSTQILQKRSTDPTDLTLLNNIGRSTQKMLALINALLDVSKIQSGKLEIRSEDVEVAQFLRQCHSDNEMIGKQKGIALVLSVNEDIGHARFDKERMHQAVDNLLSNAFKFSNPNTMVTLGAKRLDHYLEIRVEDQGVGIKDEDLPLLFEEFSKASAQPTGGESSHGLGLAIVKRVVELQGGRIQAKNNLGGGAIFTITLP